MGLKKNLQGKHLYTEDGLNALDGLEHIEEALRLVKDGPKWENRKEPLRILLRSSQAIFIEIAAENQVK